MVKKKTARQKVRDKGSKEASATSVKGDEERREPDSTSEWGGEADQGLKPEDHTRIKRKMAKQLRFLSKLQETQRILSATKTISKKRKGRSRVGKTLNDLSSLAEFLPSIGTQAPAADARREVKILRSKARQKIVVQETKQLAAVLGHPLFQSNPFSAIQQHLTKTLPPPAPPVKSKLSDHRIDKKDKKKQKQRRKQKNDAERMQT